MQSVIRPSIPVLIERLLEPAPYPHPTEAIRLVETHISWVILTGPFAYKLKKPVSLGFVDYTTLDLRRRSCEGEVRVSGRFAPELYVAAVPITGSVEVPCVGGEGEPIEYAVKLVQFDEADRLDSRFVAGRLTAADCRALGEAIAAVEECLPAARPGDPWGTADSVFAAAAANLTAEVVSSWVEATGDHGSLAVLPIYEAYRAIVRASIAAIRGGQGDGATRGEGLKYLDLAERLAVGEPPAMIVTCGMSGSGKSTVAAELVGPLAGVRIRSDVERKRLAGMRPTDRPTDAVATEALYDESCTRRVYDRLATLAGMVLDAGRTVVIDATCIKRWQRDRLAAVALDRGVPLIWVVFDLPTEAVLARLATRQAAGGDPSDASVAVVRRQLAGFEPLANEEAFGNAVIVRVAATDGPAEPAAVAERVVRARSTLP